MGRADPNTAAHTLLSSCRPGLQGGCNLQPDDDDDYTYPIQKPGVCIDQKRAGVNRGSGRAGDLFLQRSGGELGGGGEAVVDGGGGQVVLQVLDGAFARHDGLISPTIKVSRHGQRGRERQRERKRGGKRERERE